MNSNDEIERLASRVRASARDGGLIETAQVKLLGLDDVRTAAGARWPRMREYVRAGSLKIIAAHLGAEDSVIPCGDGFLVVFADAAKEAVQKQCEALRDALVAYYLGEEALKSLRAGVEHEAITAASLASFVAKSDPDAHLSELRNELQLGRFWPIWSMRHGAIAAHLCAPAIETNNGRMRLGYAHDFLEKADHRDRDYLDLDLCLLEQACASAERNGASPIGVSVHSTTLQSRKSRKTYLDHAAANATRPQQRMFISVSEIAPGTPLISLNEWSNALRRIFPRVAFGFHHSDRALSALGSTGIWAAGYHLPPGGAGATANLRGILNELNAWCRTLRAQGIQPFIHGFDANALLDLASYSDLGFASGDGLWPCQGAPSAVAAGEKTAPQPSFGAAP
jgi:hypothetical protein